MEKQNIHINKGGNSMSSRLVKPAKRKEKKHCLKKKVDIKDKMKYIITLNINGLISSIRSQSLSYWLKYKTQLQTTYSNTERLKIKGYTKISN